MSSALRKRAQRAKIPETLISGDRLSLHMIATFFYGIGLSHDEIRVYDTDDYFEIEKDIEARWSDRVRQAVTLSHRGRTVGGLGPREYTFEPILMITETIQKDDSDGKTFTIDKLDATSWDPPLLEKCAECGIEVATTPAFHLVEERRKIATDYDEGESSVDDELRVLDEPLYSFSCFYGLVVEMDPAAMFREVGAASEEEDVTLFRLNEQWEREGNPLRVGRVYRGEYEEARYYLAIRDSYLRIRNHWWTSSCYDLDTSYPYSDNAFYGAADAREWDEVLREACENEIHLTTIWNKPDPTFFLINNEKEYHPDGEGYSS
ncbi:MAG: hypothetical protein HWN65_23260 [Candidatus Helarchaeota archaeon]|nr:hypothetical protein [Candidatus Helarchaeota archaeon]